ncbi:hypothetical protein PR202_ga11549 [Eleusine coracana subsp. coracana]|uniref:Uncharacterized protein n=1 Tax=Eleusine coracana subsp. coracana TaxID=191504 RepID=A0AAV5C9V1_ELECO|nr:hypothetical protein PR202_ga11549 [Eleusine coracana subsp. coracana]
MGKHHGTTGEVSSWRRDEQGGQGERLRRVQGRVKTPARVAASRDASMRADFCLLLAFLAEMWSIQTNLKCSIM